MNQRSRPARLIVIAILGIVLVAGGVVLGINLAGDDASVSGPAASAPVQQAQFTPASPVMEDDISVALSLERAFNAVARQVLPVVVEVNTVNVVRQNMPRSLSPWDFFFGQPPENEQREFRRPGLGSGVLVRRDGRTYYVLSNNHVVGEADEITIRLNDGREFDGEIVGADPRTDLALVSFSSREEIPVARLGDSDALDVGDWVVAVGNPFGFESTVTTGIVSALRRDPQPGSGIAEFTDYIQTDAAINPGNSGGALVNLRGEVVGINTWIASRSGGSVGLGFAIPINNARRVIDEFIEEGRVSYGWLGVTIADPLPTALPGVAESLGLDDSRGALVTNLIVPSPAERDGLLPGDVVLEVGGRPVEDARDLTRLIGLEPEGGPVQLTVLRNGTRRTVRVTLGERAEAEARESTVWPGFTVVGLTDAVRERLETTTRDGVAVAGVVPESPAAVAGLRAGDVIVSVERRGIADVAAFYEALSATGDEVLFEIRRAGTTVRVGLFKP